MRTAIILSFFIVALAFAVEPLERFQPKQPEPLAKEKKARESQAESKTSAATTAPNSSEAQIIIKLRGLIFVASKDQLSSAGVKAMDGVSVERVPMLNSSAFTQRIQKYIGQSVSLDLVNAIAADVARYYREHDHPVVSVVAPEQDVTNGVVQLLVTEAKLGAVHVAGNKHFKSSLFRTGLKPGDPIIMSELEADTAFYGRNPFRSVTAELAPGKNSGETDITLRVQDKRPLRVFAGYNNAGVESTGENQLFAGFNYGNLFGLGDELNYQFTGSADFSQLLAQSASWTVPLPWRDVFQLSGTYSVSNPKFAEGAPELKGTSWQVGTRYILVLPSIQKFTHELALGYDYKFTNNNLQFGGQQVFETPVNISEFSLGYSAALPDKLGRTALSLVGYWSPGGMGAYNNDEDFEAARVGSTANYFYATLGLDRMTKLPLGCTWSLSVKGQLSNGNLQATEQFLLGGESTVRGYPELIAAGDQGILVRNEIYSPSFSVTKLLHIKNVSDQLQFLAFYDYGVTSVYQALPGEDKSIELQGSGIGLRWQVRENLSVLFDYGWQIHDIGLPDHSRANIGVTASF